MEVKMCLQSLNETYHLGYVSRQIIFYPPWLFWLVKPKIIFLERAIAQALLSEKSDCSYPWAASYPVKYSKYIVPINREGEEDWLFTITSYNHFRDLLQMLTGHQMYKQGRHEAFFVWSLFILEGMTRFITSLAQDIVASTELLLQSCANLQHVVRSRQCAFQCRIYCPKMQGKFFCMAVGCNLNGKSLGNLRGLWN